jgi:Holliday junction DNA helicase RuvA
VIARVRGTLLEKTAARVVVEAAGIGYEVEIPLSVYRQLGEVGSEVSLLTHLSVREDGMTLFGFARERERRLFRHLLAVAGVGPRLAMKFLSTLKVEDLERAILAEDVAALSMVSGVGKKTAQRVLVDLKPRLEEEHADAPSGAVLRELRGGSRATEATEALLALGFGRREAWGAVTEILEENGEIALDEVVRRALQTAARGGSAR